MPQPSGNSSTPQPRQAAAAMTCGALKTSIDTQMIRAEPILLASRPAHSPGDPTDGRARHDQPGQRGTHMQHPDEEDHR
ncbi:hypothetical protein GCM10011579_035520 [Streptomyces albiflavescens]|uniref:Uncharacterized protein n=1 Tax=Streptomyces albiflavescens TaxID=1623582 RepID=A0A917Y2Q9_9ACTN|nr:hypothetical protein GCM10011579_035520 [Streptomyces albiflavescens]